VISMESNGSPGLYSKRPDDAKLAFVRICSHYLAHDQARTDQVANQRAGQGSSPKKVSTTVQLGLPVECGITSEDAAPVSYVPTLPPADIERISECTSGPSPASPPEVSRSSATSAAGVRSSSYFDLKNPAGWCLTAGGGRMHRALLPLGGAC
jgi:hypothetical protein